MRAHLRRPSQAFMAPQPLLTALGNGECSSRADSKRTNQRCLFFRQHIEGDPCSASKPACGAREVSSRKSSRHATKPFFASTLAASAERAVFHPFPRHAFGAVPHSRQQRGVAAGALAAQAAPRDTSALADDACSCESHAPESRQSPSSA